MQSNISTYFYLPLFFMLPLFLNAQNASQNMTLLGNWDIDTFPVHSGMRYNDIWGYVDCSGGEYAIIGSVGRVNFVEVTNPVEPRIVASFPGTVNSIWRDFKTYRDRAYACADQGQDGLMIFDMSGLPDTVIKTYQSTEYFQRSHNVWIDTLQGRMYMAGANTRNNGVIIFDLTENPDVPVLLASIELPGGYVHDIHVVNHIGYASHGNSGLYVYDFTNPEEPILLGSLTDYPERGYNHSSWLSADGNYLIMADETHGTSLKVVDVQEPEDMSVVSLFKSALLGPDDLFSIVHNPFVRDQYVVMAYYHDGIQIFDMTDPANVERAAFYDTYPDNVNYSGFRGAWGTYPYLPSGNILGSDITYGLFVLSADSIEFQPAYTHRFPDANILTENPVLCDGAELQLNAANGAENYTWLLDGGLIHAEGNSITTATPGIYQVQARNGHCVSISEPVEVFAAQSIAPVIGLNGTTLECGNAVEFLFFQWYLDGLPVPGANAAVLGITESGTYTLETVDENGCRSISQGLEAIVSSAEETVSGNFRIFPNPASHTLNVDLSAFETAVDFIRLSDANGQLISRIGSVVNGINTINISALPAGMYVLQLQTANGTVARRFVKS
ncbi:MAG: choice-of-anchor B family protein [Saprospiraceae bacterium]|nr:choice-of-anchor B family protein [Saprospiraceae bacterium]